jgi:hypothetical protein
MEIVLCIIIENKLLMMMTSLVFHLSPNFSQMHICFSSLSTIGLTLKSLWYYISLLQYLPVFVAGWLLVMKLITVKLGTFAYTVYALFTHKYMRIAKHILYISK